MSDADVDVLLNEFAGKATAWTAIVDVDAKSANRVFDRLHALAKQLRQSPSGRDGLVSLIDHENLGVRLLAATECLPWASSFAVPALEAIQASEGLHAIDAKYTLKSHRSGTLNLDW